MSDARGKLFGLNTEVSERDDNCLWAFLLMAATGLAALSGIVAAGVRWA